MDDIKLIMENDKYIEGKVGGKAIENKFSDIKPYWDYATADDCEFSSVLYNENEIIGLMTTAQGQGGIVFVWDIAKSVITHISEASYAVGFYLFKGMIYWDMSNAGVRNLISMPLRWSWVQSTHLISLAKS